MLNIDDLFLRFSYKVQTSRGPRYLRTKERIVCSNSQQRRYVKSRLLKVVIKIHVANTTQFDRSVHHSVIQSGN